MSNSTPQRELNQERESFRKILELRDQYFKLPPAPSSPFPSVSNEANPPHPDAARLRKFVRDAKLNYQDKRLLAYVLIVKEFEAALMRGEKVTVEEQAEKYYQHLVAKRIKIDRCELLKRLVQREMSVAKNSPLHTSSLDDLKKRFPEIADFFNELFRRFQQAMYSRSASRFLNVADDALSDVVLTEEHYQSDSPNGQWRELGSGGFKNVYAARQTSTNQTVALKRLNKSDAEARNLFKSEVLIQTQLAHPNVPQIFSFDESGKTPTLVEQLITGQSWASIFDQRSFEKNVETLALVARVVAHAHKRRHIAHLDLKPENVMLGADSDGEDYNEVYLVDWGLAFCFGENDDQEPPQEIGATLDYQPPETFLQDGKEADKKVELKISYATDVFMLGGILFRILTGEAPYSSAKENYGESGASEVAKKADVPPIDAIHPKTGLVNPPELIAVAEKALRYNPEERYRDAGEFLDALERYRRRAGLGERLRKAQNSFAELRQEIENAPVLSTRQKIAAQFVGRADAVDAARLVETTNEFRLLREETARSDADGEPSQLFWDAVASEREAHAVSCDAALKLNYLGVARSLVDSADELEKTVRALRSEPDSNAVAVASFRARLDSALRWNFVQRCALVGVVALTIVASGAGVAVFKANAKTALKAKEAETARAETAEAKAQIAQTEAQQAIEIAKKEAEKKIAQKLAIEQSVAPVAAANWNQGEVALRSFLEAPEEFSPEERSLAERSGIFLEAVSPRRFTVDSVAFSTDEKYFATLGNGAVAVFANDGAPSESVASVAQIPLENYDGKQRLRGNPAFVDANSDKPELKSQFLLCRDDGVVFFLSFGENGETSGHKIDVYDVNDVPKAERAIWGAPCFATNQAGAKLLIVPDASGAAAFYSLSDGRLAQKIQLCEPVADEPPILTATPDGETLLCVAPDGSFKRWTAKNDKVETLDLPLSPDADLSLGGLLRYIEVSPDGKTIYVSDDKGAFVVWDAVAQKTIYAGQDEPSPAQCKRCGVPETTNFTRIFRIDDDRFLTLGFNDRWRLWDLSKRDDKGVPSNVELRDADAEPSRALRAWALSPSRRALAFSDNARNFGVYDLETRRQIVRSEGFLIGVYAPSCAAYLPKTDRVVVGAQDFRPLASYAPQTLRAATQFEPYSDLPAARINDGTPSWISVPTEGDEFAAAFCSGDVFFFKDGVSEPTGKIENAFVKAEKSYQEILEQVYAEALQALDDPDASEKPRLLDDPEVQEILLGGNQAGIENPLFLAATPSGSRLVGKTALGDEFILWDWAKRAEIKRWRVPKFDAPREEIVAQLKNDISPLIEGALASGNMTVGLEFISETELLEIKADGSIVRHDVEKGETLATIPAPRPVLADERIAAISHSLSNDRRRLALGFGDGAIAIVDLESAKPVFYSAEFAQPLPKRPVLVKRSSGSALEPSTLVGGLVWSRDDSLLCATFGNGQAVLLETRYFTKLNAFVVADSSEDDLNGVFVLPFFTRDAKLVTVDTRGFLKRWDFRPSPEKPRKLDADRTIANQGADYLAGTSRPNLWAKTRDSETQNFPFVINDGGKEIYRQENVEYFQRLTEPGATRESFLLLDKDGLLSAIDETGAPVELGVDWNLGAPGVTPKEAERQAAALNVSPEAQAEIDRLPEEFVKKYPNGDHPEEELDQLLAQIEALTPQPADDEITFEEDALNVSPDASIGFIRVAVSPNRRAFAAIGKSDGALYVLTRAEAAEGWRLVAEPQDAETPFARLAFRPDSRELAAIDEDGRVTFVPFDAAPDAPNEVVWSQKTFVSNDLGAWPSVNGGAFVYTTSGKFLLQTGLGNPRVFVWDVETRSQTSFIEPKFYERTLRDPLVISDIVPLRLNDGADAFVVAGRADGVLRFYRYNDANGRFSQVYATSPTKLSDFIESEESAQSRENHNQILRQLSGGNEFDSERNDTLFWDDSRLVGCLSVSDDQKTLYVGSLFHFQVCSYDLDEIRRNIETLPEYWRDFDVESATGLRYTSQGELKVVDRERLVPVEAK